MPAAKAKTAMGTTALAFVLTPPSTIKSQAHIAAYGTLMKIQDAINKNEGFKDPDLFVAVTALINGQVGAHQQIKPEASALKGVRSFGALLKPLSDHVQAILSTSKAKDTVLKDLQTLLSALLKGIEDHLEDEDEETRRKKEALAEGAASARKAVSAARLSNAVSLGAVAKIGLDKICPALGMSKMETQTKTLEFLMKMSPDEEAAAWEAVSVTLAKAMAEIAPKPHPTAATSQLQNSARNTPLHATNRANLGLIVSEGTRAELEGRIRRASTTVKSVYSCEAAVQFGGKVPFMSLEMLKGPLREVAGEGYPLSTPVAQLLATTEVLLASEDQLKILKQEIDNLFMEGQLLVDASGTLVAQLAGNLLDRVVKAGVDPFASPDVFRSYATEKLIAAGLPLEGGAGATLLKQLRQKCIAREDSAIVANARDQRFMLGAQGYLAVAAFKWLINMATAHSEEDDGGSGSAIRVVIPRSVGGVELPAVVTNLSFAYLFLKGLALLSVGMLPLYISESMRVDLGNGSFLPPPPMTLPWNNPFDDPPTSGASSSGLNSGGGGGGAPKRVRVEEGITAGGQRGYDGADKRRDLTHVGDSDLTPDELTKRLGNRRARNRKPKDRKGNDGRATQRSGGGNLGRGGSRGDEGGSETTVASRWFALRKVFMGNWRTSTMGCPYCGMRHGGGECSDGCAPSKSAQVDRYKLDGKSFLQMTATLDKYMAKISRNTAATLALVDGEQ